MKEVAVLLALVIIVTSVGMVEAQRRPMRMPMKNQMHMGYRCLGLEGLFLVGPIFELIGHVLFFTFSRSAMLCMKLAMRFVK
jgi:uncharacterized membrane protein